MRLNDNELKMMNNKTKDFLQRNVEFPVLQRLGLRDYHKEILEIGCGSGYGAELLARLQPAEYVGIDLMPEQIALAKQRGMNNYTFMLMDASNLGSFPDASKDIVTVFRIFHHMPEWKIALREVNRVLRPGGKLFVVEPIKMLTMIGILTIYEHPREALFTRKEFAHELQKAGFIVHKKLSLFGFNFFYAQKITQ